MESKLPIDKKIEDTFKVLDTIEAVKVSHFFKHKVLQQIENQQEEKSKFFGWFSPQLQLATLGLVLLMNVSAVFYAYSSEEQNSEISIEAFAEQYSLQTETNFLLN
jgi:hypothetical protein